jgi:hypothetical protein
MVATCANPTCKREFTDLRHGRLFLLSPVDAAMLNIKLSDYLYWLCPECAASYTMWRNGNRLKITLLSQQKAMAAAG